MQCVGHVYITLEGEKILREKLARLQKDFQKNRDSPACKGVVHPEDGKSSLDVLDAEETLRASRIREIRNLLAHAKIAPIPTNRKTFAIGTIGTFMYRERNKEVRVRMMLVGHEEGDCGTSPIRISYTSPIGKVFVGKEVGHPESVLLNGKLRLVTLTNIRLPR